MKKNGLGADKSHFIKLKSGASITGRVLQDGKPVKSVAIVASDTNNRRWNPIPSVNLKSGRTPRVVSNL